MIFSGEKISNLDIHMICPLEAPGIGIGSDQKSGDFSQKNPDKSVTQFFSNI